MRFHTLRILYVLASALLIVQAAPAHAASKAQINATVTRGVAYLKTVKHNRPDGEQSLAALALLKAGEAPNSPEIVAAITGIRSKAQDGKYAPIDQSKGLYEAGVDAMLLADADGQANRETIEKIVEYILSSQRGDGNWGYPHQDYGDTSICQYSILGLWAAARAGILIPPDAWDKAAAWHLGKQEGGGWAYHPGKKEGPGGGDVTHNMTAGATGSLGIIRMHLYPNAPPMRGGRGGGGDGKRGANNKASGVLKKVELNAPPVAVGGRTIDSNYKPNIGREAVERGMGGGLGWLATRFRPAVDSQYKMYYYYTMERAMAVADVEQLGGKDWFSLCADVVIGTQQEDGGWKGYDEPKGVPASLAILFLTRSTGKLLGREPRAEAIAGGLMKSGEELPDNLNDVVFNPDGTLSVRTVTGPVDDLLAALENPKELSIQAVQKAIVEKVRLSGDKEELIGQMDRLVKLAKNDDPEVRRTVVWALGRSGDVAIAPTLVEALKDDNVDVLVEARNALCFVSRKPHGFGLAANPLAGVPENSSQARKDAAMKRWRDEAYEKWHEWYLSIRPYEERDDLISLKRRKKE